MITLSKSFTAGFVSHLAVQSILLPPSSPSSSSSSSSSCFSFFAAFASFACWCCFPLTLWDSVLLRSGFCRCVVCLPLPLPLPLAPLAPRDFVVPLAGLCSSSSLSDSSGGREGDWGMREGEGGAGEQAEEEEEEDDDEEEEEEQEGEGEEEDEEEGQALGDTTDTDWP